MILILDEGTPLRVAAMLRQAQVQASHILELGMGGASDHSILDKARLDGAVVVTLDADFHHILAMTGATLPSVIRIRMERVQAPHLAQLLLKVLERFGEDLAAGVAVSISHERIRLRKLPLQA